MDRLASLGVSDEEQARMGGSQDMGLRMGSASPLFFLPSKGDAIAIGA